jgi:hypothetical protein
MTSIFLFNFMTSVAFLPLYDWENWGSERWSDFSRSPQLVRRKAKIKPNCISWGASPTHPTGLSPWDKLQRHHTAITLSFKGEVGVWLRLLSPSWFALPSHGLLSRCHTLSGWVSFSVCPHRTVCSLNKYPLNIDHAPDTKARGWGARWVWWYTWEAQSPSFQSLQHTLIIISGVLTVCWVLTG